MDKQSEGPANAYAASGVNLDRADAVVDHIRRLMVARPDQTAGAAGIGEFAAQYRLEDGTTLVAGADGVGSKVLVAVAMNDASTVGVDLVAMNVNDVVAAGGRPLFFLDYIAVPEIDPNLVSTLVGGMLDGCRQAGCVLIGGETAELPDIYRTGEYDLAGFAVGLKEFEAKPAVVGDAVVGILSRGFHSNGFSLLRSIVADRGLDYHQTYPEIGGAVLGGHLLTPTPIYVKSVLAILAQYRDQIHGMAHITGGGLIDNLPRALPKTLGVELDRARWEMPAGFHWFQQLGALSDEEMLHSFNGGIGFALVVAEEVASVIVAALEKMEGPTAVIGRVSATPGVRWT